MGVSMVALLMVHRLECWKVYRRSVVESAIWRKCCSVCVWVVIEFGLSLLAASTGPIGSRSLMACVMVLIVCVSFY